MRVLLDTHAIIWWLNEPENLGREANRVLLDSGSEIFASPVSAWEITRKHHNGKLKFDINFNNFFEQRVSDFKWRQLPLTIRHATVAARLPSNHKDPFDRMLTGQASVEQLTLVTIDPAFKSLGVATLWWWRKPR